MHLRWCVVFLHTGVCVAADWTEEQVVLVVDGVGSGMRLSCVGGGGLQERGCMHLFVFVCVAVRGVSGGVCVRQLVCFGQK